MPLPKPISYPSSLTRAQWQRDKSVFASKTGVGKKLEELEKGQASLSCQTLLAVDDADLSLDEATQAGKKCAAELTALGNFNRRVKEFVDFITPEIKKAQADKLFPAATRKAMEGMRTAADTLHKQLVKRWNELDGKVDTLVGSANKVKAEFDKRQKTAVDKAVEAESLGRQNAQMLTSMLSEAGRWRKLLGGKDAGVLLKVQHEVSGLRVRLHALGSGGVEEWKTVVGEHRKWLAAQPFKLPLHAACSAEREVEVVKVYKQCAALRSELQGVLNQIEKQVDL